MYRIPLALAAALCVSQPLAGLACSDAALPDPSDVYAHVTWPDAGDVVAPDARIDISIGGPSDPGYGDRLRVRATIDGAPVEGAVQAVDNTDWRFWWAPSAPWPDGAEVEFTVWLDDDEARADTLRFTVDEALAVPPAPLHEATITVCVTDVVTERAPCEDFSGCGCTGEPRTVEQRVRVQADMPGQHAASRRGFGITYGFGETLEDAEAGMGILYPGRETISRNLPGDPAGERCVVLRRADADGVVVERHAVCATPVARCDGEPLDAADAPAGCSQPMPDGPPHLPWLLLCLAGAAGARRLRSR